MRIFGTLGAVDESTRSVEILASTPNPVDGEALITWDLERFAKNPVILWGHDTGTLPIGRAENVRVDDDGLKMRVVFASADANPQAELIWNSVKEQTVRTVSVGFEPGKATTKTVDGKKVTERTANVLLEVSFVSVPKDEDAGVITPTQAASALARSRHATRTDAADVVFRWDAGERLARFDQTSLGGARIPARLSRTGILIYRCPDGTTRRELRTPDEIFKADSLATLEDVPVIDFADHRELVTPETFRTVTRGSVRDVRHDDKYIESDLLIQDASMLDAIEQGDRTDISCGYLCRLDPAPGIYEGEPYDVVQRDIRYNHVALCPPNRGRAGPDVGLRLDAADDQENTMKTVRLDGKDYEVGSEAHLEKIDSMHKTELATLQKRLDEAEGEKDEAKEQARKARDEAADAKAKADDERKKREADEEDKVREGTRLRRRAERLLAAAREEESDDDDNSDDDDSSCADDGTRAKRDAGGDEEKLDGLSDREVMLAAIKAHRKTFDAKDRSDDYIRSRFDSLEESVRESKKIGGVARNIQEMQRRIDSQDSVARTPVEKAKEKQEEYARNAWKSGSKR